MSDAAVTLSSMSMAAASVSDSSDSKSLQSLEKGPDPNSHHHKNHQSIIHESKSDSCIVIAISSVVDFCLVILENFYISAYLKHSKRTTIRAILIKEDLPADYL